MNITKVFIRYFTTNTKKPWGSRKSVGILFNVLTVRPSPYEPSTLPKPPVHAG